MTQRSAVIRPLVANAPLPRCQISNEPFVNRDIAAVGAAQAGTPATTASTWSAVPTPRRCGAPDAPPAIRSPGAVIGLVSIPAWAWLPAAAWLAPPPSVRRDGVAAVPSLFAVATSASTITPAAICGLGYVPARSPPAGPLGAPPPPPPPDPIVTWIRQGALLFGAVPPEDTGVTG